MNKVYIAIDLKSFYASVECVDRGLDPLTAKLVVADESRTNKTICLAVSPALKEYGIPGRARLYEVKQKARGVDFIIAPPRMKKYMEISTKIFSIYASFIAPRDIHVYSVDEVFMDVTSYLKSYKMTAHELARTIIAKVLEETGITATAGIGTNLYLAKIAMDIKAKHMPADKDGVRIAELDEESFQKEMWDHEPLTDFWRIGPGTARRLNKLGIYNMGQLATYAETGYENLYREFGKLAELVIDHAYGYEPVTMEDIKSFHSKNRSMTEGQVLSEPYTAEKARLVMMEMADKLSLDLTRMRLTTDQIVLTLGYDVSNKTKGEISTDFYGRKVPKHSHGTINLNEPTYSTEIIMKKTGELFDRVVKPELLIRRMYIVANHVKIDNGRKTTTQLNLFTDYDKQKIDNERSKRRQKAILEIKSRYGKNAILRGMSYEEGATMRRRNEQIGGHKA
jgi:DNA polymerase V